VAAVRIRGGGNRVAADPAAGEHDPVTKPLPPDQRLHESVAGALGRYGMISPHKVTHDEPLSRYVLDRMVAQEDGTPSMIPGFYAMGNGCYRRRKHKT
jgi:hypothetical protein